MNRFLLLLMIVSSLFYNGCATTVDLQEAQGRFNTEIRGLKEEGAVVRRDTEKNNEAIADLRKSIADVAADVTGIREDMESLRGDREMLGKGESDLRAELLRKNKELADLTNSFDQLSSRMKVVENLLEIGRAGSQAPQGEKSVTGESKDATPGKTEEELAYSSAYDTFKAEKFEKARDEFQSFLKQYPNSEYSDSPQFWIGESYYFEKKYEQAILEYEKVIKNYPKGNKVPHSLLKQGFSFLNLGDKPSGKLILEQVVKDYPSTSQARIAKAKLAEIK